MDSILDIASLFEIPEVDAELHLSVIIAESARFLYLMTNKVVDQLAEEVLI
ncbi:hypothetical protein KIN20_030206 [Parelaphostrongylus tenuis]|uniref:Uncharacterized protein n=1 Tax=Parelaphostrongylus tenuis TaxID=148309 RepID=A0AAD5WGM2_PARTN|nr:hypothetical protein KIN20_030206 [Parelaphostrongylus tenuis]